LEKFTVGILHAQKLVHKFFFPYFFVLEAGLSIYEKFADAGYK
jgi:hypothetical protein